jgi:hypothetical protein
MEAIFKSLTAEEVTFCLRCDRIYTHVPKRRQEVHPIIASLFGLPHPMPPGGLTSIFEIVRHAEMELTVGTMWRTRQALGDLVVEKNSDNVLGMPDHAGQYFALIAGGRRRVVERALDGFVANDDLEREFRSRFRKRLRSALKRMGTNEAVISAPDPGAVAKTSKRQVGASVRRAFRRLQAESRPQSTTCRASSDQRSKATEGARVRFPTLENLRWNDVSMEFVSDDAIQIAAREISKRYTFEALGFMDHRKGDRPIPLWLTFKRLAEHDGRVDGKSWRGDAKKGQAKKAVSRLRVLLKDFMGIDDDPFLPYAEQKAYVTKFRLGDRSFRGNSETP